MDLQQSGQTIPKWLMAGGSVLLAIGLLVDLRSLPSLSGNPKKVGEACQTMVQEKAQLSRQQLLEILTVSEGDKKQRIRAIVKEPFCTLATLQVRTGPPAQREAYPMAFDPQTWLIVLYEGDQYAGYDFQFR